MSLPKFNLDKLRKSVSRQQAVIKKDIANLLLLDRLQSQIARQKGDFKKIDAKLDSNSIRVFLEFTSSNGKPIKHINLQVERYPRNPTDEKVKDNIDSSFFAEKVTYVDTPLDTLFEKYDPFIEASDIGINQSNFLNHFNNVDSPDIDTFLHMRIADPKRIYLRAYENIVYAVYDIEFDLGETVAEYSKEFYGEKNWIDDLYGEIYIGIYNIISNNNIEYIVDKEDSDESLLFENLSVKLSKIQVLDGDNIVEAEE